MAWLLAHSAIVAFSAGALLGAGIAGWLTSGVRADRDRAARERAHAIVNAAVQRADGLDRASRERGHAIVNAALRQEQSVRRAAGGI